MPEERVAEEGLISEPAVYHTQVSNLVTDANCDDKPLSFQIREASQQINKSLSYLMQRFRPQRATADADIVLVHS